MKEQLTSDHSFAGRWGIDEKDVDPYTVAAEHYVAERGVEFQEWKAEQPPSEFPYAIMHPGRLDIYANSQTKTCTDFDIEQKEKAATSIVEALGLLEFIPETERRDPILICASPAMQRKLKGPIETRVTEIRDKYCTSD